MDKDKVILPEIIAFLPVYIDMKGNCTEVYTRQGEEFQLDKSARTILNQLCDFYLINLKASKDHFGERLAIKNLVPVPFNGENVFIPVKTRKPRCKNDGSCGYVDIKYIDSTASEKAGTKIYLKNNKVIHSLHKQETVEKHIKNGYLVKDLWNNRYSNRLGLVQEFYEDYNGQATKGDIAMVISIIEDLEEEICAIIGSKRI